MRQDRINPTVAAAIVTSILGPVILKLVDMLCEYLKKEYFDFDKET
jgi:hypothetical protein